MKIVANPGDIRAPCSGRDVGSYRYCGGGVRPPRRERHSRRRLRPTDRMEDRDSPLNLGWLSAWDWAPVTLALLPMASASSGFKWLAYAALFFGILFFLYAAKYYAGVAIILIANGNGNGNGHGNGHANGNGNGFNGFNGLANADRKSTR